MSYVQIVDRNIESPQNIRMHFRLVSLFSGFKKCTVVPQYLEGHQSPFAVHENLVPAVTNVIRLSTPKNDCELSQSFNTRIKIFRSGDHE